jgi:hypothetical protein
MKNLFYSLSVAVILSSCGTQEIEEIKPILDTTQLSHVDTVIVSPTDSQPAKEEFTFHGFFKVGKVFETKFDNMSSDTITSLYDAGLFSLAANKDSLLWTGLKLDGSTYTEVQKIKTIDVDAKRIVTNTYKFSDNLSSFEKERIDTFYVSLNAGKIELTKSAAQYEYDANGKEYKALQATTVYNLEIQ